MFDGVHGCSLVAVGVAQLAPTVYHSGRLGRLVWSRFQVYLTIFKTLSKGKSSMRSVVMIGSVVIHQAYQEIHDFKYFSANGQ